MDNTLLEEPGIDHFGFESHSTLIKTKVHRYVDDSSICIVESFQRVSKRVAITAHKLALTEQEIAELRAAGEAALQRRLYKRKHTGPEEFL